MSLTLTSPCKVNLILNILGKRADGFHELETVMQPVPLHDTITFDLAGQGISLSCSDHNLAVDGTNLVHRAAASFLTAASLTAGVKIHLEKRIPMAAGLGGGSGNAAITLLGLNQLFGNPLAQDKLVALASALGSDVPFFLQSQPALAVGRGERVQSLKPFAALQGSWMLLTHPGFGISTAWAYKELANYPAAFNGRAGRALELIGALDKPDLSAAGTHFYNSLEAPALHKYPILSLFQEFLRENGAKAALMSGSGSTTFALFDSKSSGESAREAFLKRFGANNWTGLVAMQ